MASASMDAVIRAEHRSPTDPRSPGQTLRTRGGCSYSSRRTPFLMQENSGLDVGAPPSVRKGSPTRTPSHPARVLLRFEKNPVFDAGEPRFGCRSTALGAKGSRTSAPSHPGRVLLRCGESSGLDVGAPPSVRKGVEPERLRTRGGCSYRSRGTPGLGVGESRSWRYSCDNASA